MLSCICYDDDDYGPGSWWYEYQKFAPLETKYRRRCKSCGTMIELQADCVEFRRNRAPISNVEEKIYGEGPNVPLTSWYFCENCGEIFWSLKELGFCIDISENMEELLKDYQRNYTHPSWRKANREKMEKAASCSQKSR